MAIKPVLFKPQLMFPEGINNYPGTTFRCFTKGDSLPFKFQFTNSDGIIPDVTGWTVTISMSNELADNLVHKDSHVICNIDIPLLDLATAIFEGNVIIDGIINNLPNGLVYALAKFTIADGSSFIMDMCVLEMYPNLDSHYL